MHVSGLFIYPVKSLRGYAVPQTEVDALGFVGDRRFLVVDAHGKFQTQRAAPRMARIATKLHHGTLTLSADGAGTIDVPTESDPAAPLRTVSVWKSEGLQAEDCGEPAATWLSEFLGFACRLVRIGERFSRPVLKAAARPGDLVTFADAVPVLVISEASLADLNNRILENNGESVPMDRFRPNLVIAGCEAFAEDRWSRARVGDIILRSAGPSARCVITTTDQRTGERGKEPLRTLATFRRDPRDATDVIFGTNLIHETKRGSIRVGDPVEFLP
ncbi:MAG TPA: MOSC N-terminal beta barrel domain-containing protein [Lacunisphaera sp.]|nr:MOSC N-terminal beta barrel domain-containing protein [Lacunisphaera sp.]